MKFWIVPHRIERFERELLTYIVGGYELTSRKVQRDRARVQGGRGLTSRSHSATSGGSGLCLHLHQTKQRKKKHSALKVICGSPSKSLKEDESTKPKDLKTNKVLKNTT